MATRPWITTSNPIGLGLNIKFTFAPQAIPVLSRRFDETTLAIELSVPGRESAIAERKYLYSHHKVFVHVRASRVY